MANARFFKAIDQVWTEDEEFCVSIMGVSQAYDCCEVTGSWISRDHEGQWAVVRKTRERMPGFAAIMPMKLTKAEERETGRDMPMDNLLERFREAVEEDEIIKWQYSRRS